jgi:hypothetical protein
MTGKEDEVRDADRRDHHQQLEDGLAGAEAKLLTIVTGQAV